MCYHYLMKLQKSHQLEKRDGKEVVSLGDVVVHEETRPNGLWRLGNV